MKKLIYGFTISLFVTACGVNTDETIDQVETTSRSSFTTIVTTTSTSITRTTTTVPETTTTTVNIEDVILPTITFPNCPEDQVTGDEFELFIKVTAGNYDLNYLRISQWKNEEYDGRIYYEKSNPDSGFPFPNADESVQFSVSLFDNDKDQAINYEVFINISDESDAFFEVEEKCNVIFNNVPSTTTTASVTSTIKPIEIIGVGDDIVSVEYYSQLMVAEISGNSSEGIFTVKTYNNDELVDTLIITSEIYSGVLPFNFGKSPNLIEVKSSSDWKIVLKPVSSVRIFDGSFIEGSSDDVIYFPDNLNSSQVLEITGNSGEGIFSIKTINCDGEFYELLVLTADQYSGTVRSSSNTCYLQITSSNNDASQWTISR